MARPTNSPGLEQPFNKVFPQPIVSDRAPTSSDYKQIPLGTVWINKSANTSYFLTSVVSGSANWSLASPGTSQVDALDADSGTSPVVPSGGIVTLTGGTNIATVGGTNEITFNLDDAIVLATSVSSPVYTVAAGTDLSVAAAAGQDVIVTLGDSAGATSFIVEALDGTDLWTVASDGTITFSSLTVAGNFAQTGGTFNVGQDNAANAVNIGGGTTARAIAIGNGTGAHTVAIGQAQAGAVTIDTAAGVSIDSATASNFTVTGASADLTLSSVGGSVNLDASEAAADAISIQASDAAGGIDCDSGTGGTALDSTGSISLDAAGASNFSVSGAGIDLTLASAAGRVIVNGEEAAANAITLLSAAGGLDADVALQMNLASSQAAADAVVINASAGGVDVTAATNDLDLTATAASVVITGGEAVADAVTITASDAAGGVDVNAGTGGVTVDTTAGISLDAATASNFTVTGAGEDLTLASAGGSVAVSSTEDAAGAINLTANGGTSETITVTASQGTGAASVELVSTAGGITLTAGLASADAINLAAAAGGVDIDGALQVNVASSQAAADAVRLVASDAAGGVTLECGTGNVNVTGGNLVLSDVATQLEMNGGAATDFIGTATLANGEISIANTNIAANDRIFLQRTAVNASTALGFLIYTISAGTNFTVESKDPASPASDETGDQSSFTYFIVREN
jgi:hypothetical protein